MQQTSLAINKHREWKGKIETKCKVDLTEQDMLCVAYTPGVAEPCLEIQRNIDESFSLTGRGNTVAVITDGTAILGLGNIGPEAGMPVMEGKCALFKTFGGVDAVPLCLKTTDTEEIIKTVKYLEGSFGGINLEDISAPRCFEIERRLKQELSIPVFHDDQHGTAIVVGAALINALKIVGKKMNEITAVVNGAGAAGIAIGKYLLALGVKDVIMCDKFGVICKGDRFDNPAHEEISRITNKNRIKGALADALRGADLFVGVSVGNVVSKQMIAGMNKDAIVFPLANPVPEISYDDAKAAGAAVVGTGSSLYPNQINNVLVFPGVFRGALDVRASDVNLQMMLAASYAIAEGVSPRQLEADCVIPRATDKEVHARVAQAVAKAAEQSGVAQAKATQN